ncbi:MAG: GNAT family N-acetyltransferase [Pirellulaceae bacterium]
MKQVNLPETERTIVDKITLDDASFILKLVNSPGWVRFIGDRNVANVDDACSYLRNGFLRSYDECGFSYYVARLKPDLLPIGIGGFLKKPSLENPDFGFALLPNYFGQGLALEFSRAILDYGIQNYSFRVLDAVTTPDNIRSIPLLEKLGFIDHGIVKSETGDQDLRLFRWRVAA